MPKKAKVRGAGNEIVFSDFLRKRPFWLIIGIGGLLAVTVVVGVVVYSRLWSPGSPEQGTYDACQDAVIRQLDAEAIRFVDESTDEASATLTVTGTAEIGWSDRHDYTCTYSGGELVEATVQ